MAAEAVTPAASFEAQHHDEYIDYSEDDAAGPTVAAQGSNHNSLPANAHVVPEVSEKAGTTSELDIQTVDVQFDIETKTVAGDAHEPVDVDNIKSAALTDEALEGAGNAPFNDNEISWEDGPIDSQVVHLANDDADAVKGGEQQVEEQRKAHEEAEADLPQGLPEEQDQPGDESEETYNDLSGYGNVIDANQSETVVADGYSTFQEQTASTQEPDADGDLHEIDYFEDGNAPVDSSGDVAEAQRVSRVLGHDDSGNAQTDQNAEDHAMDERFDSAVQHDTYTNVVTIEDDADDHDVDDRIGDAQENTATGDDMSPYDRMEYEDEVLASVQSPESDDAPSNDDTGIPAITVIYKGVEYPFFYNSPGSEGKECFFDDLSLLHCKIEGVLAGFRRELSNELGPLDDLVFQIDELGLEFAESTQPEMFSDITLGQIISVFDSLVKNGDPEDPDASKPLYAFLTTRPNCRKKWLSLVEDAYDGKGLDEVYYHFASPGRSDAAEPEVLEDEPGMIGEEDNADADAWPTSPVESRHGDQDDAEEEIDQETRVEQDVTVEQDETNEDDVETGVAEDEGATQVDSTFVEDTLHAELTVVEDLDAEATMVDTDTHLMDESTIVADFEPPESNNMSDMGEDQEPQTSGENETNTSNPLINVDTDAADLLNFDEDDQNWPNDEDSTAIMDQIIEATDGNSANKVTPNTSATSTLNGDEATYENNDLDLNADVVGNADKTADAGGQNDELGEIDWREFPEQGEEEIAQSPPTVGKRPRSDVDDLLDDEAEKDVKRRRS